MSFDYRKSASDLPWVWMFYEWHYENIELAYYKNYLKEKPMKVTVKKRAKVIDWKTLPGGTVVEFGGGMTTGLVYEGSAEKEKGIVLLTGFPAPTIAEGYLDFKITKVLGKITEIIVEEQ